MRLVIRVTAVAAITVATAALAAHATAPGKNGQIAFRRFFDSRQQTGAIFLINPDGSGESQLTHPPAGAIDAQGAQMSFSPDGTKLLFTRSVRGADQIWRINSDGSGELRLSPAPRFSNPKGKQVNQQNA